MVTFRFPGLGCFLANKNWRYRYRYISGTSYSYQYCTVRVPGILAWTIRSGKQSSKSGRNPHTKCMRETPIQNIWEIRGPWISYGSPQTSPSTHTNTKCMWDVRSEAHICFVRAAGRPSAMYFVWRPMYFVWWRVEVRVESCGVVVGNHPLICSLVGTVDCPQASYKF